VTFKRNCPKTGDALDFRPGVAGGILQKLASIWTEMAKYLLTLDAAEFIVPLQSIT
jgi:hypothetical protein